MNENNVTVAEAYYIAMREKNVAGMGKYLHPAVHFKGPLAEIKGKEEFLEAASGFVSFFKTLTIRAKFGSGDQAMLVYDLDFPEPIGKLPTAGLLTFQDGLIAKIELFCDGRPFEREKTWKFHIVVSKREKAGAANAPPTFSGRYSIMMDQNVAFFSSFSFFSSARTS